MSYLLEALGRGLLADLRSAFEHRLPANTSDESPHLSPGTSHTADEWLAHGTACLRDGRLREAELAYGEAQARDAESPAPALGLACVQDELGRLDHALSHLQTARQHDRRDAAILFAIGFCHERLHHPEEARDAYVRTAELCPRLRNAYERLAALAIVGERWAEAILQYERLAKLEPGDLDVLLTLGNLYLQVERFEPAAEYFQQALLIEPESHDGPLSAADQLAAAGQLSEAIATLEQLVERYPGAAPFHVRLGDLYVKVGNDAQALAAYRTAVATQPSFLEATVKLGTQHLRQGRYDDAAFSFNQAVELNDRLMTAFVGLGVAQYELGQRHEALATWDLAASLEPSSTLLFSETARLHLKSQHTDEADGADDTRAAEAASLQSDELIAESIRRHQQALLNAPNQADLHYRYGLLLRQAGRYEEAIAAFGNAVRIHPSFAKAQIKLAVCLKECGQTDAAVAMFRAALQLDAPQLPMHYGLGLLFAQRNQFDLAAEQFEQVGLGPDATGGFRANLSLALQNIGMVDRAAATWRSICDLAPGDAVLEAREHVLRSLKRT
jgi:tetratricopeptide (TPR) repeat protein